MSGSRIVICKDKAEALRMCDAGLLMIRVVMDSERWSHVRDYRLSRDWVVEQYGMSPSWPPKDFGYLAEDES